MKPVYLNFTTAMKNEIKGSENLDCDSTRWRRLCDAAKLEGTMFSHSGLGQRTITPRSLIGSYFGVWDSHTGMEAVDDVDQEVSYLDLAMENPSDAALRAKKNGERQRKESTGDGDAPPLDPARDSDAAADFAHVWGRFRWWRMLGRFKGLYRPVGAPENVWYFGRVEWTRLGAEPDDDGAACDYPPPEPEDDVDTRDAHDFGLAVLCAPDARGRPFVEMLYNATRYYTAEMGRRGIVVPRDAGVESACDYVRILWKRQDKDWDRAPTVISDGERWRLRREARILELEPPCGKFSEFEGENKAEDGLKRKGEMSVQADDAEEEKAAKRVKLDE